MTEFLIWLIGAVLTFFIVKGCVNVAKKHGLVDLKDDKFLPWAILIIACAWPPFWLGLVVYIIWKSKK